MTQRREAIKPGKWMYLTQVHDNTTVVVDRNSQPGVEADALVTTHAGVTLAIATADCASIALASDDGVIGAVHAGWAGLYAGVVSSAVDKMRSLGAQTITAALGPCIHPCCYEFTGEGFSKVARKWGSEIEGRTRDGATSFDLPEAVRIELDRSGVALTHRDERCTGCSGEHFSYRKTKTTDRQVMLVTM